MVLFLAEFGGNGRKVLAVRFRNGLFQIRRLTRAIGTSETSRPKRRSAVDFIHGKHFGIDKSKRDIDHAHVRKKRHCGQSYGLLTATLHGVRVEATSCLANQSSLLPQAACGIEKGLFYKARRAWSSLIP
jgi:hypothetical protein